MPTGVEVVETGEKFEDNALPWDSVDAATYVKSGDLKPSEPELIKDHQDRIAKNAEFQYIISDIARFNANKDKRNIISLNLANREKENREDDARRLERVNARLKVAGKNRWRNSTICRKTIRSRTLILMKRYRLPTIWRDWIRNNFQPRSIA